MVAETTERGSVFDVGALFEIPGHDVNRAVFRHVLYSRLGDADIWKAILRELKEDDSLDSHFKTEILSGPIEEFCSAGALTHHLGMLDAQTGDLETGGLPENPSAFNVVRRFSIIKPPRIDVFDASLFDYSVFRDADRFVVPLEFIVRFGVTSASSVYRKYQKLSAEEKTQFERELGAREPLQAWQYLSRPITDFTTKFEPADRLLSRQEALCVSSLTGSLFEKGTKMALLGAFAVRQLISELGLKLWDIKWEFARDGDGLIFVDTIDTDSFRATLQLEFEGRQFFCHCNKQAMRDYFHLLHGDWIESIAEAKKEAGAAGVDFTEILAEGQKSGDYPATPQVNDEFISLQEKKMKAIYDFLLSRISGETARGELREVCLSELAFYQDLGKLDEAARLSQ